MRQLAKSRIVPMLHQHPRLLPLAQRHLAKCPCVARVPATESAFAAAVGVRYGPCMSTLAEIEQAAEVLPVEQKQRLLFSLLVGLRKGGAELPPPRDIPKATIEQWVADDEEGFRKFKAGV